MVVMLLPVLVTHFPDVVRTQRFDLQLTRVLFALVAMLCGFTAIIHMPVYRWSAVAIGFIGVLIMLRPGTDSFSIYGLMAVVGAASAGFVMVIIRLLSRYDSPNTILMFQAVGVAIVMIVPAILNWVPPTPREWAILAAIGFVSCDLSMPLCLAGFYSASYLA